MSFQSRRLTFRFPNVKGRYVNHVVNWDEGGRESVHLAGDGEDFIGVICSSSQDHVSVDFGPIVFLLNGEGRHLTAGEHLVGAEINGVGGYVREAKSLEHVEFGITTDSTDYTFNSRRGATTEPWPRQTRSYTTFTGTGDPHIATLASDGIVIPYNGIYSFDVQLSFSLRAPVRNLLSTVLQVDNDQGHVRSLLLNSSTFASTSTTPWELAISGFTPPLDYLQGDKITLDFLWNPVSSASNSNFTCRFRLIDTLGIENFVEVDRFNFLDGSHGSVIFDTTPNPTAGVAPKRPDVEAFLW